MTDGSSVGAYWAYKPQDCLVEATVMVSLSARNVEAARFLGLGLREYAQRLLYMTRAEPRALGPQIRLIHGVLEIDLAKDGE